MYNGEEEGMWVVFFFSSRRRHTRLQGDWSSDVCSSDLIVFCLFQLWESGTSCISILHFSSQSQEHCELESAHIKSYQNTGRVRIIETKIIYRANRFPVLLFSHLIPTYNLGYLNSSALLIRWRVQQRSSGRTRAVSLDIVMQGLKCCSFWKIQRMTIGINWF